MADRVKVTLIKSTIGAVPKNKKTIEALGLDRKSTRLNSSHSTSSRMPSSA